MESVICLLKHYSINRGHFLVILCNGNHWHFYLKKLFYSALTWKKCCLLPFPRIAKSQNVWNQMHVDCEHVCGWNFMILTLPFAINPWNGDLHLLSSQTGRRGCHLVWRCLSGNITASSFCSDNSTTTSQGFAGRKVSIAHCWYERKVK